MSTTKHDLIQLLDSLNEEDLEHVLGFVKVLLKEPEDLTEEELREVEMGEDEIRRGEWVLWEDVKRTDV